MKLHKDTSIVVFLKSETEIEEVKIEDDEIIWKPDENIIEGDTKEINAELEEVEEEITSEDIYILVPKRNKSFLFEEYHKSFTTSSDRVRDFKSSISLFIELIREIFVSRPISNMDPVVLLSSITIIVEDV